MKALSRFLSPAALFAWGTLMLYFYLSGRLGSYLIPMYRPGVALAGVAMLGLAAAQLYSLRFGAQWQLASGLFADDGSDQLTSPNRVLLTQILAFVLLVVPVWAAVGVSKDSFSASTILARHVQTDSSSLPGRPKLAANAAVSAPSTSAAPVPAANSVYEPPLPGATPVPATAPVDASADAAQYLKKTADGHILAEVTDLLFASEDDTMRPLFANKTVEMIGQFMPVKDAAEGKFQLVRMFMVCCAADARPVGIAVLPPTEKANAKAPEEMTWTKVTGTVTFPMDNGRRIPIIHATNVAPTDPPSEAMLY